MKTKGSILKIKSWLNNKIQFEPVLSFSGDIGIADVRRLKDGYMFKIGYFHRLSNDKHIKADIMIYEFDSDLIHIKYEIFLYKGNKSVPGVCEINDIEILKETEDYSIFSIKGLEIS